MFDDTTQSIRQGELAKIRAARDALGLEELAKRYAPATAKAEELVSSSAMCMALAVLAGLQASRRFSVLSIVHTNCSVPVVNLRLVHDSAPHS